MAESTPPHSPHGLRGSHVLPATFPHGMRTGSSHHTVAPGDSPLKGPAPGHQLGSLGYTGAPDCTCKGVG